MTTSSGATSYGQQQQLQQQKYSTSSNITSSQGSASASASGNGNHGTIASTSDRNNDHDVMSVSIGSTVSGSHNANGNNGGVILSNKMNQLSVVNKNGSSVDNIKKGNAKTKLVLRQHKHHHNHHRSEIEEQRDDSPKTPSQPHQSIKQLNTSPIASSSSLLCAAATATTSDVQSLLPLPSPDDSLGGVITGHFTPLPIASHSLSSDSSFSISHSHSSSVGGDSSAKRTRSISTSILSPNFKMLEGCLSWSASKNSSHSDESMSMGNIMEQRDDSMLDSSSPESCNWRSTFSPFPIVSSKNTNAAAEHSPLLSNFHPSPTKFSSVNKVSQGTNDATIPTPKTVKQTEMSTPMPSAAFSPFYAGLGGLFSPAPHPMTPYSGYRHPPTERVRNLRGNVTFNQHYGGTMPYPTSMASPLVAHPAHYGGGVGYPGNHASTKCYSLKSPLPTKFQGDMSRNATRSVPDFTNLINFPPSTSCSSKHNLSSANISKICVMCGKMCQVSLGKKAKSNNTYNKPGSNNNNNVSPIIPSQNKGLCTSCDVNVWVVVDSSSPRHQDLLQIKWCKGCKNFRPWASFGEKGLATKCVRCRTRQREKYALQKKEKEMNLSTLAGSCSIKVE